MKRSNNREGLSIATIVIWENGQIGWLVEDMGMFSGLAGIDGSVQFSTA